MTQGMIPTTDGMYSQEFILGQLYERTKCLPSLQNDMTTIKASGCKAFSSVRDATEQPPQDTIPIPVVSRYGSVNLKRLAQIIGGLLSLSMLVLAGLSAGGVI